MNILLFSNLFPTPTDPERGVFTLQLAKQLNDYCNVTVVCPLPWFPNWPIFRNIKKYQQFSAVPTEYLIEGIKVYSPKYLMIPKFSERFHSFLMTIGVKKCVKELHKINNFDIVNSQWLYPDSVAIDNIIKNLTIPHIPTGLGCDINRDLSESYKAKKVTKMLNNAKIITVVSSDLKKELIKRHITANKIKVILNGIDTKIFKVFNRNECREKLKLNITSPMITYVGRLSSEKNIGALIDAVYRLKISGIYVQLFIVGDGPEYNFLTDKTRELQLSDCVTFVGKVEHKNINIWLGATDYFSLPSIYEGCPNVVLEALGSGRPVISSNVGAIPDLVNSDSGILFDPTNIAEIVDAFKNALNKDWDENLISDSVKNLSWSDAAHNYFKTYEEACKL